MLMLLGSSCAGGSPPHLACRACKVNKRQRPRGLCNRCYSCKPIRAQFPYESICRQREAEELVNSGSKSYVDTYARAPLAAIPTCTLPGTVEKVCVMRERAERGEQVFHPLDTQLDLE